ncbi:hypothetical protein Y032_0497g2495 [Ancylostoma ceylanicum]|nr:hypothetical protein Y032_0497g2495 [Ancylostoma ceylanicum]
MNTPSDTVFKSLPVEEPVFVAELPPRLHIGTRTICSRMSNGNFSVTIKITVPSIDAFGPVIPTAKDEDWGRHQWHSRSNMVAVALVLLLLLLLAAYILGFVVVSKALTVTCTGIPLARGKPAQRVLPKLIKDGIVKALPGGLHENAFFPKLPFESHHFCIMCGTHKEFRLHDYIVEEHKATLKQYAKDNRGLFEKKKYLYELVEQLSRGVT